jgi:hypothetical protein
MQMNIEKYTELRFIVGNEDTVNQMVSLSPGHPFTDEIISFLNDLSRKVMCFGREYSDVATFGFWCRRSALSQEKRKYDDISRRLGRGIVFHSTPSNVPINFAFSFAVGLLSGNANIVRLPGKEFAQVNLICDSINELLDQTHQDLKPYICMIKYPPVVSITDIFSALCDTRVVWGGDETIAEMRQSPLKPRANEITFADRYSIAVINTDAYMRSEDKEKIARDFYNDTYLSDQNACTSPRVIIWIGTEKKEAKEVFWNKIHLLAKERYALTSIQSLGKLSAFYKVAVRKEAKLITNEDNYVTRIAVEKLDEELMDFKYNSGYFFEYDAGELKDILPICTERCQTLIYYGLSRVEIKRFLHDFKPRGVDRAVPIGKSMDFHLVWDGYDLIRSLSRIVSIM